MQYKIGHASRVSQEDARNMNFWTLILQKLSSELGKIVKAGQVSGWAFSHLYGM